MRFIHISDLHFFPEYDGRTSKDLRKELTSYLKEQGIKADELLFTGDVRHAGLQKIKDEKQIECAVNYIIEIARTVGITDNNHIHIVPGNHDCDRVFGKDAARLSRIRNKYDADNGNFSKEDLDFLSKRFEYFHMVCDKLYGIPNYWSDQKLHTYRKIDGTVYLYLNTAIMHNNDIDRKERRLLIGNNLMDLLLEEIKEKYPDCPIIVLAHHSPDMFKDEEKKAVEDILEKYPNVLFYLCGDSHKVWPRRINSYIEITIGCLKQERDSDAAFLYGDTNTQTYVVYQWQHAWQRYEAYIKKIQNELNTGRQNDSEDANSSEGDVITIEINQQKRVTNKKQLRADIIKWIANGKRNDVRVDIVLKELKEECSLYESIVKKISEGISLRKKEEGLFQHYNENKELFDERKKARIPACEYFLKDSVNQNYFCISEIDDYEYILTNIASNDNSVSDMWTRSNAYTKLAFITDRDGENMFSFCSPIRNDMLKGIPLNTALCIFGYSVSDIGFWDKDTTRIFLSNFYKQLGQDAYRYEPDILSDKRVKELKKYRLGMG